MDKVKCTDEKCEFHFICNNMMSENALQEKGWCDKPTKNITK